MAKKMVSMIMILCILMMPGAFAFSFMGIDFEAIWDKVTFWNDEKESNAKKENKASGNSLTTSTVKSSAPNPENKISLAGIEYTETSLKSFINKNEDMKNYIKSFGYECIFVETDKGTKFTMQFNTDAGTMKSLKIGNFCSYKEIYLEESLINEISENGFSVKEIKSYLKKVDLPWSMYAKAAKIFALG